MVLWDISRPTPLQKKKFGSCLGSSWGTSVCSLKLHLDGKAMGTFRCCRQMSATNNPAVPGQLFHRNSFCVTRGTDL